MKSDFSEVEDAFAVLASRLRLQILETLCEDDANHRLSFTKLYQAVDAPNTSQFSYHLEKLSPTYVDQTDGGYVIRDAGRRIVQSVKAGEYTVEPRFDPVTVTTYCPHCGEASARATYDGRLVTVDCQTCEENLLRYDLRPAHVANRGSRDALRAADRQMRAEFDSALDNICQRCGGSVNVALRTDSNLDPDAAIVICDCAHCGATYSGPVEMALLTHPSVIEHYWAEDLDTSTAPLWELFTHLSEFDVETVDATTILVKIPSGASFRIQVTDEIDIQQLE